MLQDFLASTLKVLKDFLHEILLLVRVLAIWLRLGKFVDSKHGQEGENAQVLDLGFLDHLNFTGVHEGLRPIAIVLISFGDCKVPSVISLLKIVHELIKMS